MPFIVGIVVAYDFQLPKYLPFFISSSIIVSGVLFVVNILYKRFNLYQFKHFISASFYLLFFLFGASITLLRTDFLSADYFGTKTYKHLKIVVDEEPQLTNGILRFVAKVKQAKNAEDRVSVKGFLLVALKVDTVNPVHLKYGDELWISAKYAAVEPPYNPGEFNFKAWLASKNIYHQTFVNQHSIVLTNQHQANPIIEFAINLRQRQVEVFRKIIKNDEAFAVASTLILGYRADLSKETLNAYSKTGTIHALSVSGMHVGLIYLILTWLLMFCDRNRNLKLTRFVLIATLIWYYSLITGLSPSVLRSAIMLSAFMIAKLVERKQNSYNVISFTALGILIYDPFLIFDVGFQLSFLAVLGLIYLQPKIYKWVFIKNKYGDKLWQTIAMSSSAQLATFPLSIYYFHQFPVYFLIANLFIFIPITLIMYLGLIILISQSYMSSWFNWLNYIFEWLIIGVNDVLKWIADLPFAGITAIWINAYQMFLLGAAIFMLIYALANYGKKLLFFSIFLFICFQSFSFYQTYVHKKQAKIIFFSLRKNYASAYVDGKKAILLTDLKSDDKNFEFFVKPALDQMQITAVKFIKWEDDYTNGDFLKRNHQVYFKNHHTFLYSDSIFKKDILGHRSFDALWLHKTVKLKLASINQQMKFKTLIVDATNKDYYINKYKTVAKNINLDVVVLKKSKALTINLNQ